MGLCALFRALVDRARKRRTCSPRRSSPSALAPKGTRGAPSARPEAGGEISPTKWSRGERTPTPPEGARPRDQRPGSKARTDESGFALFQGVAGDGREQSLYFWSLRQAACEIERIQGPSGLKRRDGRGLLHAALVAQGPPWFDFASLSA